MSDLISEEDLVYYITKEDIQLKAKRRIGRELLRVLKPSRTFILNIKEKESVDLVLQKYL
jgi:hypothetical protein